MRKHLSILIALIIAATASTTHASCLEPDVKKGFEQAKVVFIGEVEEITLPPRSDEDFFFALVKFNIEWSAKGASFGSVTVRALQGNVFAALPAFRKGERYLVYADAVIRNEVTTDDLVVNACNRTALLPRKPPRPIGFMFPGLNREDGTADLRALNALLMNIEVIF